MSYTQPLRVQRIKSQRRKKLLYKNALNLRELADGNVKSTTSLCTLFYRFKTGSSSILNNRGK